MKRRAFLLLISIVTVSGMMLALASCGQKNKTPRLPQAADFKWGQNPELSAEALVAAGWERKLKIDDELRLVVPVDEEARAAANAVFSSDIPENHQITLYSQDGRLVIVSLFYRDSPANMAPAMEQMHADFKLDAMIWQSPVQIEKTAVGTTIEHQSAIYDTGELFVVVHDSRLKPHESIKTEDIQIDMASGANAEVEMRFFHKHENEGLSGEALIERVKAGLAN
ncbi:MAG: hypothetical protein KDK39_10055 [Leptospiraceae bacterium]|nr:hypothetical protein [Leptospiraceae bacterium]